MADALAITLQTSGTVTASGTGAAVDIGATRCAVRLDLQVSAINGAGARFSVKVETALSASGPWRGVADFPALTVATFSQRLFGTCERFVRVRWTLDGTAPDVTFSVAGEAHCLYANLADVGIHAIDPAAFGKVSDADKAAALLGATDEADSYLAKAPSITLPLATWSEALTMHVARIAAYGIMLRRGFQPQGTDELIVQMRKDAIEWLKMVASGDVEAPGGGDPDPDPGTGPRNSDAAHVYSQPARGW